jgi:leucyl/phenylalanyl-tRNA--protein transferase
VNRRLTPQLLLTAYAQGIFPMADDVGRVHWLAPDPRAIIELDDFRTTRSLRAVVRRGAFEVWINRAYAEVMTACGARPEGTWISPEIHRAYVALHELGYAHSVECWQDEALVGGLYGVSLGGAFFGESMFHAATDASKVALVHLVERMKKNGLVLLDIQFVTPHLLQFGAVEIPRETYEQRLHAAIVQPVSFAAGPERIA